MEYTFSHQVIDCEQIEHMLLYDMAQDMIKTATCYAGYIDYKDGTGQECELVHHDGVLYFTDSYGHVRRHRCTSIDDAHSVIIKANAV
jgi:hypothetical protein